MCTHKVCFYGEIRKNRNIAMFFSLTILLKNILYLTKVVKRKGHILPLVKAL